MTSSAPTRSAELKLPGTPSNRLQLTIDIGPLFESQWTGIPVFTRRLVESLLRDGRLGLSFSFNLTRIPTENVLAAIKAGTGTFLRQEFEEAAFNNYEAIDVTIPILYPSVKRGSGACEVEASTIHDISTLIMPENHEDANVAYHLDELALELKSNNVTFCVSEATKAALESYFPSVSRKTRVLYQYADWPNQFANLDRNLPRLGLGRYAIVIGTIEPRKNLGVLIKALALPEMMQSDLKFIVIGKIGWLVDQFLSELDPAQRQRIMFSGFVSEFTKYRLIAHSEFLVFPSIYEGFGIPALEALSLGKPVLAARTSSFPEVIGPAGLYFDPFSASELAAGIVKLADQNKLAEVAGFAADQSRRFGWERMAAPIVHWIASL